MRYVRVKDVGTRHTDAEQRNNRIVEIAEPLPGDSTLSARSVYWFVTTQPVAIEGDPSLFEKQGDTIQVGPYHLHRVNFKRNRSGKLSIHFPDGQIVLVSCKSSCQKTGNKRRKIEDEGSSESESAQLGSPVVNNNNTNVTPNMEPIQNVHNHDRILAPAINVNVLLFVPAHLILSTHNTLLGLQYNNDAYSVNLSVYSRQQSVGNQTRHVMIFPYTNFNAHAIHDCLAIANDVLLLVENPDPAQPNPMMVVKHFTNFNRIQANQLVNGVWQCVIKPANRGILDINYDQLDLPVQNLLSINELESVLSSVSCRPNLPLQDFEANFYNYFDLWSVQPPAVGGPRNMIYLCFHYDTLPVMPLTDYADITLQALGLHYYDQEPVVAPGSVLVYIRCPAYVRWLILAHQEEILNTLAKKGLTKIYECFISDVDASLNQQDDEEFLDELMYLKEQMISDGIEEHATPNK